MSPEFAKLVNPVFDSVLELVDRIEMNERPDLNEEKTLIRQDLDKFLAAGAGKPEREAQELELARRVLTYWVDEILTNASPSEWKGMTIEFDNFGERNRAFRFYEFGERVARNGSTDLVETWYLCLVLGFEGDIGEAFREHLHQPLPGGVNSSVQARQKWAEMMARQIRKPNSVEMSGEPLSGGVEPLMGPIWLKTMAACLFVASVTFVVLFAVFRRVSQS